MSRLTARVERLERLSVKAVKKTGDKQPNGAHKLDGPGPGRPAGVPNKLTRSARENIDEVYRKLGDVKGHVEFLQEHPRALADFYSHVYPLLLAIKVEHSGPGGEPMSFVYSNANGNGNGNGHA